MNQNPLGLWAVELRLGVLRYRRPQDGVRERGAGVSSPTPPCWDERCCGCRTARGFGRGEAPSYTTFGRGRGRGRGGEDPVAASVLQPVWWWRKEGVL